MLQHETHDDQPLDSDEQSEVVNQLAAEIRRQTSFFERAHGFVLLLYGIGLVFCVMQLWQAKENTPSLVHRDVMAAVPEWAFQLTYAGQLFALFIASRIAKGNRWYVAPGLMVSWASFFSWFAVMHRLELLTRIDFYWLPLGPAAMVAIALYLDLSRASLQSDMRELDSMKYKYKKL